MVKKFSSIEVIRRENVKNLMQQNKTTRIELSEGARINYALLGHYIGKNPTKAIGDGTAIKIEKYFSKPHNWLDHEHNRNNVLNSMVPVSNNRENKYNHLIGIRIHTHFSYIEEENDFRFEEGNNICYFPTDFFKIKGINPDYFRLIHALDNSMKPYIIKSDKVGIDINETDIKDGDIYAILLDRKHMMFKQIFIEPKNILRLHSFNSEYPEKFISIDDESNILIVGKQVYRAG